VLANLRKKGYLEPIPTVERVLRFAPCIPREQIATRSLRQIMRDFFGNSPSRLMAHLMNEEKVDEAELKEIRSMLRPEVVRPEGVRPEGGKGKEKS
jgi:predicted transcriptional regulator